MTLGLAPSYAVLCAAQAVTVASARGRGQTPGRGWFGLVVPAALLGLGVLLIRTVSASAFAWLGAVGTPLVAAAGRRRLPVAAALWLVAWRVHGLVGEAAAIALIVLAALALAAFVSRLASPRALALGLVALVVLDVVLVWATLQVQPASSALHSAALPGIPRLQDATFGDATMGWIDLLGAALLGVVVRARVRAAVATGLSAGAWGLLLFTTSTVPATVPLLAGLAIGGIR